LYTELKMNSRLL